LLALGAGRANLRDETLGMAAMDFPAERIERHATPELIAEMDGLEPGQTNWIGVRFQINDGWHLYWNGKNDSGSAPTFAVTLPEGYQLGAWVWPAPERHVSPGEILDHVYKGTVLLMAPLHVPKDAKAGAKVTLAIQANWLACDQDICVPEDSSAQAEFLVRAKPGMSGEARSFEAARARHAKPWPVDSREYSGTISTGALGRVATIRVVGATNLEFYPALHGAAVKELIKNGTAAGDTILLPIQDGVRGDGNVRGVLGVAKTGSEPTQFYDLDLAPPLHQGSTSPSNTPGN
jgi:hypothetical protein